MSFTGRLAARARSIGPRLEAAFPHPFAERSGGDAVEAIDARVAAAPAPIDAAATAGDAAAHASAIGPANSALYAPTPAPTAESAAARFEPRSRLAPSSALPAVATAPPRAPEARAADLSAASLSDAGARIEHTREVHDHEHTREQRVEHHHHHHHDPSNAREPAMLVPALRPVVRPEPPRVAARPAPDAAAREPSASAIAVPPIHVHIGRIVVAPEPPRPAPPQREGVPIVRPKSLAEHLAERRGRR